MDVGKLVGHLISVGLLLAMAGLIVEAVTLVRDEVVDTHRRGTVSLGGFNRRLERSR